MDVITNFFEEYKVVIFITLGIIVLAVIAIAILSPKTAESNKKSTSNNEETTDENNTGTEVQGSGKEDFSSCPGPIKLPCREGPEGPRGNPGGIYTDKGPLRNLGQLDMVVDRLDGAGPYANAYLAQRNYKPQQTWTLYTDQEPGMGSKLSNQYGGCLNIDKVGNVNMTLPSGCKDKGTTKWLYTSKGNLKPMDDTTKCLSYTDAGIIKNLPGVNVEGKNISPSSNLLKLNIVPCDIKIPPNQQWVFD